MGDIARDTAAALQASLAKILTSDGEVHSTFVVDSPERKIFKERLRERLELLDLIAAWLTEHQLVRAGKPFNPGISEFTLLSVEVSGDRWELFKEYDRIINLSYNLPSKQWELKMTASYSLLCDEYGKPLASDHNNQMLFDAFVTFHQIVEAWVATAKTNGLPLPTTVTKTPEGGYELYADRLPTENDPHLR